MVDIGHDRTDTDMCMMRFGMAGEQVTVNGDGTTRSDECDPISLRTAMAGHGASSQSSKIRSNASKWRDIRRRLWL